MEYPSKVRLFTAHLQNMLGPEGRKEGENDINSDCAGYPL